MDSEDQLVDVRAISGVVAPMSVNKTLVGRNDEIAAELQHILPRFYGAGPPTSKDETQISNEHAPTKKHRPPPAIQAEVAVGGAVWVAHRRQTGSRGDNRLRPRLCDDQNVRLGQADFIQTSLHLPEVRQAGNSPQVAEEHQQHRRTETGKPDRFAIGAKKGLIRDTVADSDHRTNLAICSSSVIVPVLASMNRIPLKSPTPMMSPFGETTTSQIPHALSTLQTLFPVSTFQ